MFGWLAANIGTIIVCLILAAAVTGIIIYMVKSRKNGSACSGCTSCGSCPHCHKRQNHVKS